MPSITHLYGETFSGHLLDIKTPSKKLYYFQNYSPGNTLTIDGKNYQWLPFNVANFSESLDINSEAFDIQVVNTPTVGQFFQLEGDIRKSIVVLRTVFPNDPGATPDIERSQVSSYTFTKAMVQISCASPIMAINNSVPTRVFDPKTFPVLPHYNKPAIQQSGQRM